MSFEEWLFDSTKINFINLRKICCYTGGTVSIETIDKIIDGFPQLKSVHLKLCQVFYHPIQSINPKPEIAIQTLCIDIEHLTDTLILYICKRFPNVDSFTLCTSTPSVSIGPFLSKVAIDAFVSYLRSVNKFNVSFGLLENQRQLVSALSKAHWQGKRKVLLTLNDDEGCLLRRIKIQAEQFSSTGQYRTIRIKNATCLKPRLQDWIGYMSQIDRLELGDHKTKTLRDISGYLDELVLYSKQIKVLTLSNCLINCFNSTFSQASLTYLSLEDCVCSLEGYQTISRAFPNLKHISIIQSRLQNRHVIISMPFSSVDTFKFESDPLWHLDHFYLQVSTKSRFARYRHTNRHMNFYPRYQKATVLKVQVFLKQIKHLSVSLYKSNIILDHQQEIKNTSLSCFELLFFGCFFSKKKRNKS
ncbi:hypothetical protein BD560DRAFT_403906 [Blakeslea trispora]|nr:hypothetical protein BD560DRAFT_403906 [Blakeslea trispora]